MNRLTVYDPFAEVFPELFRNFAAPVRGERNTAVDIRIDVKETDKSYQVHADVPGVKRDDIHVDIDGNVVSITAEIKRDNEVKEGEKVLRTERYRGSMTRSFSLGSEIDEAEASAKMENGVLELVLPKKAASRAKRLTVN
ncbi:MAG: Hsp20/alpha crystallin family protein [Burkholderiaceae bacterium]